MNGAPRRRDDLGQVVGRFDEKRRRRPSIAASLVERGEDRVRSHGFNVRPGLLTTVGVGVHAWVFLARCSSSGSMYRVRERLYLGAPTRCLQGRTMLGDARVAGEGAVKRSQRDLPIRCDELIGSTSTCREERDGEAGDLDEFEPARVHRATLECGNDLLGEDELMRYPRRRIGGPPSSRGTATSSGGGHRGSPTLMSTLNWTIAVDNTAWIVTWTPPYGSSSRIVCDSRRREIEGEVGFAGDSDDLADHRCIRRGHA